jgi:hypothetical protein
MGERPRELWMVTRDAAGLPAFRRTALFRGLMSVSPVRVVTPGHRRHAKRPKSTSPHRTSSTAAMSRFVLNTPTVTTHAAHPADHANPTTHPAWSHHCRDWR